MASTKKAATTPRAPARSAKEYAALEKRLRNAEAALARETAQSLRHQALADASFEAIAFFDPAMTCVMVNRTAVQTFGYAGDHEMIGMHALDFVAPKSRALVTRHFKSGSTIPYEFLALRKDGSTFPAEVHGKNGLFEGSPVRISAVRDITRRKDIEEELHGTLRELEIIFANSKVGLMLLRGGRYLARANQTLADILGYGSPEEMVGMSMRDLHVDEQSFLAFGEKYYKTLTNRAQLHVEYRMLRKDGSPIWCILSGQAVDRRIPADLDQGVLWVIDDITRLKDEEERLLKLASTDHLTGANNRRHFMELARQEFSRRRRHAGNISLLLIDLDRFKSVNDSMGHAAGDAVLKNFTTRCLGILREEDSFGRLGGEEFAVLLPNTDLDGAVQVAERIRAVMAENPVRTTSGSVLTTVSVGVALAPSGMNDVDELLALADKALYRAKQAGRNRVEAARRD
ncbi:MAG: sensor domain-containing diguanylate cyclase [Desulfovibrionaceae bacterium]